MEITYPPIYLAGSVVNPGLSGLLIPDPKLKNPFREDMWVDGIEFLIQGVSNATAGPGNFLAKMSLGRLPITGGANVPIWLLGKTLSNTQDVLSTPDSGNADPTFAWRFAKPLFVPSGEQLTVTVSSTPAITFGGATFTIFAEVFGRSIPAGTPKPEYVDVPFACAFQGAENVGGVNTTDQSFERDMMNPFNVDMFVERFNGRVGVRSTGHTNVLDSNGTGPGGGSTSDQAGATNTLVRAVSSVGGMMVRDEVPFDHVFYGPERTWQVNTWIPPKAFFKFFLNEKYSGLSGTQNYRPQISMIGYYKAKLNDIFR